MAQFFAIITRNAITFILIALVLVVVLALDVVMLIMHAATISAGLQALGIDPSPMRDFPVVGPIFAAIGGGNVTIAELLGISMALVIAIGAPVVAHSIFQNAIEVVATIRHLRTSTSAGSLTDVAWENVAAEFLVGLLLAGLLIQVIVFDWELYHTRSLIDFEDAARNSSVLAELPASARAAAALILRQGAWAYLGTFLGASLVIYLLLGKAETAWFRFCSAFDGLGSRVFDPDGTAGSAPARVHYGYDVQGQPVFDRNTPVAYDVDGNRLDDEPPAIGASAEPPAAPAVQPTPSTEPPPAEPERESSANATQVLHPIHGAAGNERVTLEAAFANPRQYHVEPDPVRIWRREAWEALHSEPNSARTRASRHLEEGEGHAQP